MAYCIFCGEKVPDGAKFCIKCGKVLPAPKPAPSPEQQPAPGLKPQQTMQQAPPTAPQPASKSTQNIQINESAPQQTMQQAPPTAPQPASATIPTPKSDNFKNQVKNSAKSLAGNRINSMANPAKAVSAAKNVLMGDAPGTPGEINSFKFTEEQLAIMNGVGKAVSVGSKVSRGVNVVGNNINSDNENRSKKSNIKKYLIVALVMTIIWVIQYLITQFGIYNRFTRYFKYLTFYNGINRSTLWTTFGGLFGRGFLTMAICGLATGSKDIFKSGKNLFTGKLFKGTNIGLILFGAGLGCIFYRFLSGHGSIQSYVIGLSGMSLSLKAIGQGNGLIRRFIGLFFKKRKTSLSDNANTGIQGVLTGLSLGFAIAIPICFIPLRLVHMIFGGAFLVIGIVLFLVTGNKSGGNGNGGTPYNTNNYGNYGTPYGTNNYGNNGTPYGTNNYGNKGTTYGTNNYGNKSIPYNFNRNTSFYTKINNCYKHFKQFINRKNLKKRLAFTAAIFLVLGQTAFPLGIILAVPVAGNTLSFTPTEGVAGNTLSFTPTEGETGNTLSFTPTEGETGNTLSFIPIGAKYASADEATPKPTPIKGAKSKRLHQVIDGSENVDSPFYIEYDIKSNHELSHLGSYESISDWDGEMAVNAGDRVEIDFTVGYPKSTDGEYVGPDFIKSMARKISDSFYSLSVESTEYSNGGVDSTDTKLIDERKNAAPGDHIKCVFEIPKGADNFYISMKIGYHMESEFYGDGDYGLSFWIRGDVHENEGGDYTIKTDASSNAGETASKIVKTVVVGTIGGGTAGAGVAGAIASEGSGQKKEKEPKDNKEYELRIFKKFGNYICPGDSYEIYARIVEISGGTEKDRPDLSANIQIFSDDGVFDVKQDGPLTGVYKSATISLPKSYGTSTENSANGNPNSFGASAENSANVNPSSSGALSSNSAGNVATEGRVNFKYFGKGGTFTNSVRFFINDPKIVLNQPNIALLACDRRGAFVGFRLQGMDQDKCDIKVEMNKGSSYTAAWVKSDTKEAPDAYYVILNDINEEPGDGGTYEINTLTITVKYDRKLYEALLNVYRVTEGLNFGADRIACYRLMKEASVGKPVEKLDKNDFTIAPTKVNAYILKYDSDKREVYYKPADVLFTFETPEEALKSGENYGVEMSDLRQAVESQGLSMNDVSIDKNYNLRNKLDELGLKYEKTDISESMTEYTFFCEKAFLESPHRYHVILKGHALDEDKFDDKGDEIIYTTKKHVILESQPFRPGITVMTDADIRISDYLNELDSLIYKHAFLFMDTDENGNVKSIRGMLDSFKQTIFTKLAPYLPLIELMQDGYDPHYGYDTLKIAMIQYEINWIIKNHEKDIMTQRQEMLVKMQETAHHDANSFWMTLSSDFADLSERYVDTWGGIAFRIAAGVFTGGASEAVFLPMDVNKAMYKANEHKLLYDRNVKDTLIAGSIPIIITVATAGTFKLAGATIAKIPPGVKAELGKWASRQTGKIISKIPKSIRGLGKYPKKLYKWLSLRKEEIMSLHYDPKTKSLAYYQAASSCEKAGVSAEQLAFKYIRNNRVVNNPMSSLKGLAHDASERRAAFVLKNYKKAVDAYKANPTPEARKLMKSAYFEMQQDSLAINKLNMGTRSGYAIENEIRHADDYIEMFNRNQKEFLKDPSEPLIRDNLLESALKKKGIRKEDIKVLYTTGNKSAANMKTGMDIDLSPYMETTDGRIIYFTQQETDEAVAKAWSKVTDTPYTDPKSMISKFKGRAVTPEDPEFYHSVENLLSGNNISDEALNLNVKTGMYKMTHEYKEAQKLFEEVVGDTNRYNKAVSELTDMLEHNNVTAELSADAKALMNGAQTQFECIHQVDKIRGIYDNFNIKGMANGNSDVFSEKLRIFGKVSKQLENQGTHNANLGVYDQIMEKELGGYLNNANELMKGAEQAVKNARGLNPEATGKIVNNLGN
nr:zinc-ribbon domain-containing protein [Lachnospiraceae bacterium]